MSLAIIIPALNEEKTIAAVVRSVWSHGTPVVIDDGSTDATAKAAQKAGAVLLSHAVTRGYDFSIGTGMKYAENNGFCFAVTMDADGQHNEKYLGVFKSHLENGASLVLGVRNQQPRIAERIFSWWTFFRWGIIDPLSGMKAYRMSLYRDRGYFDRYDSIGTELTIYAARRHYPFQQVPISIIPRSDRPRFGNNVIVNYRILRSMFLSFFMRL